MWLKNINNHNRKKISSRTGAEKIKSLTKTHITGHTLNTKWY